MQRQPPQADDSSDPGGAVLPGISDIIRRLDDLWDDRPPAPSKLYDLEGQSIGGLRLSGVIGQGAFGIVYRARDEQGQRDVAIKVPRPEVVLHTQRMQRFRNEAVAAAALDHPAIVKIHATDFDGPTPHIVSEYVDGPDLGEWLARLARPVDFQPAIRFMLKLVEAVGHAHERGVTHRDLKPGNVLLQPETGRPLSLDDYSPRLTDFGLAGFDAAGSRCTNSSMVIGTPLYMAPEQAAGGVEGSPPADIYSLGVLLFELITRRTPYEGLSYREVLERMQEDRPPGWDDVRFDVPPALQGIVNKCLRLDAADRYASAAELAADLDRFLNDERPTAPPPRAIDPLVRWMCRPERLRRAAWWSIYYQSALIVWMGVVMLSAIVSDVVPEGSLGKSLLAMALVSGLCHAPKALIGWGVLRAPRPFYPVALLTSVLLVGVLFHSAFSESVAFEWNYPTRFSKVSNFAFLIMGCAIEAALYAVAWPAWKRTGRDSKSLF